MGFGFCCMHTHKKENTTLLKDTCSLVDKGTHKLIRKQNPPQYTIILPKKLKTSSTPQTNTCNKMDRKASFQRI